MPVNSTTKIRTSRISLGFFLSNEVIGRVKSLLFLYYSLIQ